jgi:proline iminopeptidase
MKLFFSLVTIITTTFCVHGQKLYCKTFGDPKDKPVLFLHGGPGYNSVNFEQTTAHNLANNGFYVIVYDRRGEGRSIDTTAQYTFQQTFEDINEILKENKISKITLLGHSFGGIVATRFAEKYPNKINQIILIGTPLSMQDVFQTIIKSSKELYESKSDTTNLKYIEIIEKLDKKSIEYSSYCFGHAIQNGFYYPKQLSEEAKSIYSKLKTDTLVQKYGSLMTSEAPIGFLANENYTSIDLTNNLKKILEANIPVYGIYGKNDGLYSTEQIENLKYLIGANYFQYLDNCSHNVFSDQQTPFIETIKIWVK